MYVKRSNHVLAGHGDVVDIEGTDRMRRPSSRRGQSSRSLHIDIHQLECVPGVFAPDMIALFRAVHCLHQLQHHALGMPNTGGVFAYISSFSSLLR